MFIFISEFVLFDGNVISDVRGIAGICGEIFIIDCELWWHISWHSVKLRRFFYPVTVKQLSNIKVYDRKHLDDIVTKVKATTVKCKRSDLKINKYT